MLILMSPGAFAQVVTATSGESFHLEADFNNHSQLSRDGLRSGIHNDQSSVDALPLPNLQQAPMLPMQAGTQVAGAGGKPIEYGVDWSHWISQLADHWYTNLKKLENRSGYEFTTNGPASIQFTCYPNGQIDGIQLQRSCGVNLYDKMQMEALMHIRPLPPFPPGSKRTYLTLTEGWESHMRRSGEQDFQPGSYGRSFPVEWVR